MRIALIADVYPPLRSSGAVQLRDLSYEFAKQGHNITVMVASPDLKEAWKIEERENIRILRLKTPKTKDIGYIRRTIGEFLMPFSMLNNLWKSPLASESWDGIVWYSPTIFLGPIVSALKKANTSRSYLIIRDIFPEWAVDMGLMGKGIPFRIFKAIANYQYSNADVIGIQAQGNQTYFADWLKKSGRRIEVLQNWLSHAPNIGCSIDIKKTSLAGRKIFVYAGNMGVAQGMSTLFDLAVSLRDQKNIGFLFVGRGSDAHMLRTNAIDSGLDNVLFFDEIPPDEIPGLYAQCDVGLVALDPRHRTHNIPGKFLSYMQSGLPVLASINPGNDLVDLIKQERVGLVCTDTSRDSLKTMALRLLDNISQDDSFTHRCTALSAKLFSPETAVRQIVEALSA